MNGKLLALALIILAATPTGRAAAQGTITWVSSGGAYQDAERQAFIEPIAKKLGIQIQEATVSSDAEVRVQVRSGAVTWDIVEFGAGRCAAAATDGLYEKLDFTVIDVKDYPKEAYTDYYLGSTTYAYVMAWNAKKFGHDGPKSWADFWDVKKFPGTRSLWKFPSYVLEVALLADGVPMDKLYPLDMDRAFKSLGRLKPNVKVWWDSGAQSAQLIKDGEVDMIGLWDGRLKAVLQETKDVGYTYNQGVLIFGCWGIVKGSKNKDLAMRVLAEAARPEYQAKMAIISGYGPANPRAFDLPDLPPEVASRLAVAPEHAKNEVWLNAKWWGENGAKASERMDDFITQR
jgi:putative spermidine/putrescine transport system substrate-binding protein